MPFLAVMAILASPASSSTSASITLEWTAPGDDGVIGVATGYDLRYNTMPLSEGNFNASTRVLPAPIPSPAGTHQSFTVPGLQPNTIYYFAIKTLDERGNKSAISNVVMRTAGGTVSADQGVRTLAFSVPYPNPSRVSASFAVSLPTEEDIRVEAFDITGRHLRTLASGKRPAGQFVLAWDLRDQSGQSLPAGVYLVRAQVGASSFTRRVIVGH